MMPHLPGLPWPPSYGLSVALGFVMALLLVRRLGRLSGLAPGVAEDVVSYACLAGLLGAKLLLVALEPARYLAHPLEILFQGGVFFGGLIGGIAAVLIRCAMLRINPHVVGDACAPALGVGHAFGRLGCFLAGCCWGEPCSLPLGVRFTDTSAAVLSVEPHLAGVPLHPVQLYEAAGTLLLAGLAYLVLRRRRFAGQAWWTYVAGYALLRLATESFRGDPRGTFPGTSLSTSQGLALVALVVSTGLLLTLWIRSRGRAAGGQPSAGATP